MEKTQMAGVCAHEYCGVKVVKSGGILWQLCWQLGTAIAPAVWLILVAPAFSPCL